MTDKPMTAGEPQDESMYEYFTKKEKEFVGDIIYAADCLKAEALKDPVDHNEIVDLLSIILSDAYRIRDLAKER